MKIGIVKENEMDDRVAVVPETVSKFSKAGHQIFIAAGAGQGARVTDYAYQAAGATLLSTKDEVYAQAELFLKVNKPTTAEIALYPENSILIAPIFPLLNKELVPLLNAKKMTVFALDMIPRIARAQAMDILSSQSSIAGYKSIILAADKLAKLFPMMTTAAGTIQPVKVMVIGAGVAGLQAIATARRLGGVVLAFDTRPIVAEQVKSLGADFVSLETDHAQAEDKGGYAKELSADFYKNEQEIIRKYSKDADVIVTTALIPGKKAPVLITEQMVSEMQPGAVIVDLAAEQGGNCALSVAGKNTEAHGVTIMAPLNLPSTLAQHASFLFARNVLAFVTYVAAQLPTKQFDLTDEIIKNCLLASAGNLIHPALQ
jgi:NAD(P) transhydrogenase subunit alpha